MTNARSCLVEGVGACLIIVLKLTAWGDITRVALVARVSILRLLN
jgi:hypothetical protein